LPITLKSTVASARLIRPLSLRLNDQSEVWVSAQAALASGMLTEVCSPHCFRPWRATLSWNTADVLAREILCNLGNDFLHKEICILHSVVELPREIVVPALHDLAVAAFSKEELLSPSALGPSNPQRPNFGRWYSEEIPAINEPRLMGIELLTRLAFSLLVDLIDLFHGHDAVTTILDEHNLLTKNFDLGWHIWHRAPLRRRRVRFDANPQFS
jgi:hypothetical protein